MAEQDLVDMIGPEVQEEEDTLLDPQAIKLSGEKQEKIVNTVTTNYNKAKTSQTFVNYIKNLEIWHKAYLGHVENTSFPWEGASNIDLGVVEMCVDNIKSRYKLSTIGAAPMFNAIPTTEEGEIKKDDVTDGMNFILTNDIKSDDLLDTISQRTVECGTCIGKLFWKRDILETKEYGNVADVIVAQDKSDIIEQGEVEMLNLEDVFVPESCPEDIDKAPWIYHRQWYSVYDLEKKVKLGFFTKAQVEEIKAGLILSKEANAKTAEEKAKLYEELPEEKVEILECYMRSDVDNDDIEEECIFWICPTTNTYLKGFYLKDVYFSGKRPFYVWRYKKTGSFYGRGVVEMILPYRTLMNDLFNYSVNCMMLQVLPWGFYRIGSSFKPEEVKLSPGVMIPIDDTSDVKMAQFPTNAAVMDNVVMMIMSFIERQTGISSPHMGKEFPTRKTATEVRTIISEGNVKHEDRIQVFQSEVSRLLKGVYNIYRQNQGKGRTGRINNGEDYRFVKLFSAFDQLSDFDFIILGTLTTGNKVIEREDTMALYSITSQNPIFAEWPLGQFEMLKEVFNTFGKRNIKRFLPPDEMIQQYSEAKKSELQMRMQMMASGQGLEQGEKPKETAAEGEISPEAGLPVNPGTIGGAE